MAKLKTTYVSGGLYVTGSENFISSSEFRGALVGTASVASNIDPEADVRVKSLDVSGSAVVGGDLKVMGDLTYMGVQDLRVKDKTIELNADDSGSAIASADGAGIVIKDSGSADITILYDKDNDQFVFSKPISGSIGTANKVRFALQIGEGFVESGSSFDGHEEISLTLDTASVKAVKVDSASRADSAAEADKVANKLTVTGSYLSIDHDFDGSEASAISIDLSSLENEIASASADLTEFSESVAADLANVASTASANLTSLSESVATDFSASEAAQATYSQSVYSSISESNAARVALSESVASSSNAFSASVAEDFTANASASAAALNDFSSSVATDFENINSGSSAAVTALSESVASDFSSSNANVTALSESLATHVSASSAEISALSESVATDFSASAASVVALSESVSTSLSSFSESVATDFSASDAARVALSESVSESIAALGSGSFDNFVQKSGDTMTGDLVMSGSAGIKFGDMRMVWDATNQCINFVADED